MAEAFLRILDPEAESFCFRTFDDNTDRGDRSLACKLNGTFAEAAPRLRALNDKGAGGFVVVNEGGQTAKEITRVRAVFADTDGAELDPIMRCGIEPHVVIETSPGRFHVYWLVDGLPLDKFAAVQASIAAEFGTDPSVIDLPRVMRLPDFLHRKGDPFRVRIIHESGGLPYRSEKIIARFAPVAPAARVQPRQAINGEAIVIDKARHEEMLSYVARAVIEGKRNGEAMETVWARVCAENDRGRWTRHFSDDELRRAFDGAVAKFEPAPARVPDPPISDDDERRADEAILISKISMDRGDDDSILATNASMGRREPHPGVVSDYVAPVLPAFAFRRAVDFASQPAPIRWLVRDWFEAHALVLFFGDAASAKTWLLMALGLHVAAGREFFGARVRQGAVFVLCGEGFAGMGRRVAGLCRHYQIPLDGLPFYVSERAASFAERESVTDVQTSIRAMAEQSGDVPVLVIVDTVSRNFGAADENATGDMAEFVRACDTIRDEFNCTVVLSHHVGHGDKTRARGNTTLRGAVDTEFRVLRDEAGTIEVSCSKMKEATEPAARRFRLHDVPLDWTDEDGAPITSAALIASDAEIVPATPKSTGRGRHQVTARRLLAEAHARHRANLERGGHDPDGALVPVAEWRDLCEAAGINRFRFRDVREGLVNVGDIRIDNGFVRLAEGFV